MMNLLLIVIWNYVAIPSIILLLLNILIPIQYTFWGLIVTNCLLVIVRGFGTLYLVSPKKTLDKTDEM